MKKKGTKNLNPYIREGVDMNIADIAKELKITQTEVETALKGIFYKFRKYIKNNNIRKQDYL
jgi:hypothetical protein